ncbi:MAG: hypothetical protein SPJ19_05770 [Candidatus Borkfalkiaceae bacterium]|nr:hypothetical protein [Christensenellaceae bacterium]
MRNSQTKKRIFAFVSAFAAFAGTAAYAVSFNEKAEAASVKTEWFYDDFNSDTLAGEWENHGGEITAPYKALHFGGEYFWAGGVVINRKVFTGKKITLEFELKAASTGNWFGVGFGGKDTSSDFYGYDGALIISTADVRYFKNYGASGISDSGESRATNLYSLSTEKIVRYTVEFLPTGGANEYKVMVRGYSSEEAKYDFIEKNGEFGEEVFCAEFNGVEIVNEYLCLNGMNPVADVLKVTVRAGENGEETILEDDFSLPSISYPSEAVGKENWHVSSRYDKTNLYIAPIGELVLGGNNFVLYSENVLRRSEKLDELFRLEVEFKINEASRGDRFGFGLGLSHGDETADRINLAGIEKRGENEYVFSLSKKGSPLERSADVFALEKGAINKLKLSAYADNRITVSAAGKSYTFYDVETNGLCAVAASGGENASFSADNFSYDFFTYKGSLESDAAINFKGIKEDEDGLSYYINEKEWYIGSQVTLPMYNIYFKSEKLVFASCTEFSCFGPKKKYADFIMQFNVKIESGKTNAAAFGLAFGKSSFSSNISVTKAVGFMCNGYEKLSPEDEEPTVQTTIQALNLEGANSASFQRIRNGDEIVDMWDGRTYNVMFVVKNRTVRVYFKEENEPVEMLAICRAEFGGVDTYGYPSVFGRNGISFDLTELKITNLGL